MNIVDIKHIHIADEDPIKIMSAKKKRPFSKQKHYKEPVTQAD
tara:strand:+ start:473 stop:601 length:129 start_codon:yes stop_codon:yes gene_type:complete